MNRVSSPRTVAAGLSVQNPRLWLLWVCCLSLPNSAPAQNKARGPDPTVEPPLEFTLEIDGRQIAAPIHLDKPFKADVGGKKISMKLAVKPYRTFRFAGVSFNFPQYYTFEADADDSDFVMWTFSGNDNSLMLFKYKKGDDAANLKAAVDSANTHYGKQRVKQTDCTLNLDGRPMEGKRLDIKLADVPIRQELYSFSSERASFVLIVQDTPEDGKKSTDETVEAIKMLEETFQIAKPPAKKK